MKRLLIILLLCSPAWAARSYISGFEMGSTGEVFSTTTNGGSVTVQTTTVHSGTYALKLVGTDTGVGVNLATFKSRAAGGTFRSLFRSVRFYFLDPAAGAPVINSTVWRLVDGSSVTQDVLSYTVLGKFTLGVGVVSTVSSSVISDANWHLIQVEIVGVASRKLYVDGVLWITDTTAGGGVAQPQADFNSSSSVPGGDTFYIDDILFDDDDSQIVDGRSLILKPTSDSAIGNWTGGGGGVTNLWDAVNNVPPVGLATASETNTSQVHNAATGASNDYVATAQSYSAGGVGSGDTVNATMAIVNEGIHGNTSLRTGSVWISTNPAQSAASTTFDWAQGGTTVVGTFSTGWFTDVGPVSTAAVTIGSATAVTVRKITSTTRPSDADFLGIYVDYTPGAAPTCKNALTLLGIGCN